MGDGDSGYDLKGLRGIPLNGRLLLNGRMIDRVCDCMLVDERLLLDGWVMRNSCSSFRYFANMLWIDKPVCIG